MKIGLIMQDFKFNIDLNDFDFLIGVDRGAFIAYQNNIYVNLAIGDFDSITEGELKLISEKTKVIKLNPIKDLTDTAEALKYAFKISNDVTMLGGIEGKRIEHFIANLCLFKEYPLLKIENENSLIFCINGPTRLPIKYKFASFFALNTIKSLYLKGFKYELTNYDLEIFDPLCISNEILDCDNLVSFKEGLLLIILSNNDH